MLGYNLMKGHFHHSGDPACQVCLKALLCIDPVPRNIPFPEVRLLENDRLVRILC
jgi:hypothetical protein